MLCLFFKTRYRYWKFEHIPNYRCDILHSSLILCSTKFISFSCPTKFISFSTTIHKDARRSTALATASSRRQATEQQLQQLCASMMEAERFATLEDLCAKLKKEKLPSGFTVVKMFPSNDVPGVLSIRLEQLDEALGLPRIMKNLTIYEDFRFRMHVAGAEITLQHVTGITAKPGSAVSEQWRV